MDSIRELWQNHVKYYRKPLLKKSYHKPMTEKLNVAFHRFSAQIFKYFWKWQKSGEENKNKNISPKRVNSLNHLQQLESRNIGGFSWE